MNEESPSSQNSDLTKVSFDPETVLCLLHWWSRIGLPERTRRVYLKRALDVRALEAAIKCAGDLLAEETKLTSGGRDKGIEQTVGSQDEAVELLLQQYQVSIMHVGATKSLVCITSIST